MPDLIGIGSINVDLVLDATAAAEADLTDHRLGLSASDLGGEVAIDGDRFRGALDYLQRFAPLVRAGGSALSVCAVVAGVGAPVSVGHIGVCGLDGPAGFSFPAWFGRAGIDARHMETVAGPPGMCLAINRDGERTLVTTGGVNDRLGRLLAERADAIADYLAGARAVHVTALAGLDDLDPLVDLLDRVRLRAPGVRLSCDPGAIWTATGRPAAADEILARCHLLLVNGREFSALGGGADGAASVFGRFGGVESVVVKGSEAIELHHRDGTAERHPNPVVLAPSEIVDDTGAGDAFAAGYLLGELDPGLGSNPGSDPGLGIGLDPGIELGMDLARAKLAFVGLTRLDGLAEVYRQSRPRP